MKAIKYVGKKTSRTDSVADTGLVWKQGQVHVVTDAVAERLLAHPDVWAESSLEEAMEAGTTKAPAKNEVDVTDAKPKKPRSEDDDEPMTSVNTRDMSLTELRNYARSHLNMTLPARITEETARRKVNEELRIRSRRK